VALIVETGSGSSTSESFASVSDVEAYFAKYGVPTGWAALTTEQKEAALRLGTRYIEATYATVWVGVRVTAEQALSWPRSDAYYNDGLEVLSDVVPPTVLQATCILAGKSVIGSLITDIQPGVKSESVSVGPISQSITYSGSKPSVIRYPEVDGLLRSLTVGLGLVRVVRG
jgi:hypothetical protein